MPQQQRSIRRGFWSCYHAYVCICKHIARTLIYPDTHDLCELRRYFTTMALNIAIVLYEHVIGMAPYVLVRNGHAFPCDDLWDMRDRNLSQPADLIDPGRAGHGWSNVLVPP